MAFHIRIGKGVLGALLLAAGCTSGASDHGKVDLAGNGVDDGAGNGDTSGSNGSSTTQLVSVTNLTSDQSGNATNISGSLINAWGLAAYQGMFWIANEGTGKVSIFDAAGKPSTGKPASDSLDLGEGITGVTLNDSTAMQITSGDACGPASLIFASVHGQLIGVNTDFSTTRGFVLVDRSGDGAAYTGVATIHGPSTGNCTTGTGTTSGDQGGQGNGECQAGPVLVLAADFFNGRIDVFDESFHLVTSPMFQNADIPAGYAPFNVMAFKDVVYVTYAKQSDDKTDEVVGAGLGYVSAFDLSGKVLWTAKGDELNAPWGLALADASSTMFSGALLVGNFGDGHITLLDPATGAIRGQLMTAENVPLAIEGLWAISFGAGISGTQTDGLYFTAGPADELHGMFGVITAATTTTTPPPLQ